MHGLHLCARRLSTMYCAVSNDVGGRCGGGRAAPGGREGAVVRYFSIKVLKECG